MTLTLHPMPEPMPVAMAADRIEPVYLVAQRANGSWSPAMKPLHLLAQEWQAEEQAAKLKEQHPQQTFGIFVLRSEARMVPKPIEIVRVEN